MTPRPSLWFVVPCHGRARLTGICLRQLRRTCDALNAEGMYATAVVIADDENLDTAHDLGFATVERGNDYLARKFNDGIQLALDPRHNPAPADYVVPCGSDDWVDWRLFLDLPDTHSMVGFQRISIVREDGRELTTRFLNYLGGSGIRIYPRALMEPFDYRPADEDRVRAIDTSILYNLGYYWTGRMRVFHHHRHDYQIVDWKSSDVQLNAYDSLSMYRAESRHDPFEVLEQYYPAESLAEMRDHYARVGLVAA